jgi:N-acetylglucosamine-6-sulfatase
MVLLFVFCTAATGIKKVGGSPTTKRNNILVLLTDDQDVLLGSFDHMPHVKVLLQEQGTTFVNGFVHTPICCPSRSSILSGKYLHNCHVQNNSFDGNCYGDDWIQTMEPNSFAVHLQNAGYTTAYTGKYLNMYGYRNTKGSDTPAIPDGWDHWWGLVGNSKYYNYTLIQGTGTGSERNQTETIQRVHYGDSYPQDYLPNVMNRRVLQWISELPQPWLIVAAWPTPHGPFTPAPWAAGSMSDYFPPHTPNFNASNEYMKQKHWLLRQLHPIQPEVQRQVENYYQMRLEALKSIDVHVAEMMNALDTLDDDSKDRTVVLYTSDNGFQFGQHRLSMDKRHLYEHDIRVPFVIRGPGIPPNQTSQAIVANIDIGPTLLDIAGADADAAGMDGVSFWKIAQGQPSPRRDFLISYHGEGSPPCGLSQCPYSWDDVSWMPDSWNNTYHCLRTLDDTENSIFCRFEDEEDFVEYYDLTTNPYQLDNDASQLNALQLVRYQIRLQELLTCAGSSCNNVAVAQQS